MMSKGKGRFAALLLLTLIQVHGSLALDWKNAEEMSCFKVDKTVALDASWFISHKTWYYPLMSRLDLYASAVDMLERKPEDISEDEVYYDNCPTFEMNGNKFTALAFGRKKSWTVKPVKGLEVFEFYDDKDQSVGTGYTVLTDNKTFAAMVACLPNNQMTWATMTTQKTLPKSTVKQIHDHMESLGFDRKRFTRMLYDHCPTDGVKKEGKNEL